MMPVDLVDGLQQKQCSSSEESDERLQHTCLHVDVSNNLGKT
jgi:hypothetical protein